MAAMSITSECSCGHRFRAHEADVGKKTTCSRCRSVIVVAPVDPATEAEPIGFQALTLEIGSVSGPDGTIELSLRILADGRGFVMIYAREAGTRRPGELVAVNCDRWDKVKALIARTDETINKLRKRGDMKALGD